MQYPNLIQTLRLSLLSKLHLVHAFKTPPLSGRGSFSMGRKRRLRSAWAVTLCAVLTFTLSSCGLWKPKNYAKFSDTFFDTFDTYVTVIAYTKTQSEFEEYYDMIHSRFVELHKLYDIYNSYEEINNIKTINDNAGQNAVTVEKDIIDLITFSKEWYQKSGGLTNIAMGSVLKIWHRYRQQGMDEPRAAVLPPIEALQKASMHTDIDKVIVDTQNQTVFLADESMSLDVGAVAKGFATARVVAEMKALGLGSAFISSSGNIETVGKPLDGVRERWGVGVQDPDKSVFSDDQELVDVIYANDIGIATSGDYQRYYVVDGQKYHHIIDPVSLMPANYYRTVTIKAPDAAVADFMSTAAFLVPLEESKALVESLDGVDAIWITPDGHTEYSQGIKAICRSFGASGADAQ